ncbi:unnamed protein product [Caenorhabditis auriculariae]|uniref:Uncharacterized protein n=1 Tax=Caenorhabditis auriculariae TaxID=2777116 RepID=A0A8S1H686_9PELO|nr:unnamed protein product [Caenorhabditis auriculariae]
MKRLILSKLAEMTKERGQHLAVLQPKTVAFEEFFVSFDERILINAAKKSLPTWLRRLPRREGGIKNVGRTADICKTTRQKEPQDERFGKERGCQSGTGRVAAWYG